MSQIKSSSDYKNEIHEAAFHLKMCSSHPQDIEHILKPNLLKIKENVDYLIKLYKL